MVILDGCAMVQVLEGQASMLGYSFPRRTDVLVCSSSKLTEIITIEARHFSGNEGSGGAELAEVHIEEGSEDILGCHLRIASHSLGQNILTSSVVAGGSLTFKLVNDSHTVVFIGLESLDRCHKSANSAVMSSVSNWSHYRLLSFRCFG